MKVTLDAYTKILLTVIAVLLTVVALGLWCETPGMTDQAQARLPDAGLQLYQIIDKLEQVRRAVTDVSDLLRSGRARVRIDEASTTQAGTTQTTSAPAAQDLQALQLQPLPPQRVP